jgi:hypothetical protein
LLVHRHVSLLLQSHPSLNKTGPQRTKLRGTGATNSGTFGRSAGFGVDQRCNCRKCGASICNCVSACVTHSLKMDSRIERRLHDISNALEHMDAGNPEVAAYCSRLNRLVSAVLVNAGPVVDAENPGVSDAASETGRISVRPGVRRR